MFEAQPWLLRGQLEAQPARPSHATLIEFYPSFDMPNIEEDSRRSQSSNSKVELTLWSNKGRYGAARAAKNKWVKLKAEVQLVSPRRPNVTSSLTPTFANVIARYFFSFPFDKLIIHLKRASCTWFLPT